MSHWSDLGDGTRALCGALVATIAVSGQAATLRDWGAVADGRTDDTQAIQLALDRTAEGSTLDGEGLVYRVNGSLRVTRDLTLRRMVLRQTDADDLEEGPHDTRTLFLRGRQERPLRVILEDVAVDRGRNPHQGSPSDAAGIWAVYLRDSRFTRVRVTGNGRGAGVALIDSARVKLDDLHIHDMTWAPCASQPEGLPLPALRKAWNAYPVIPMADCRRSVTEPRIRIQEPLAGLLLIRNRAIDADRPRISRLQARLADGSALPWQTDGITVGSDPEGVETGCADDGIRITDARIERVWEGIDVTGQPVHAVRVDGAQVRDVHAFGIKVANGGQCVRIVDSAVWRAGLAGFVVSGAAQTLPSRPATTDIMIQRSIAHETGHPGYWQGQATIAGFRIMQGSHGPHRVIIQDSEAVDEARQPTMTYGLHAECDGDADALDVRVRGATTAPRHLDARPCP